MTHLDPTAHHDSKIASTTESGAPRESDAHSLSVGADGPLMLHDVALVEKLARFDRERIPERSPHAKGSGAFGDLVWAGVHRNPDLDMLASRVRDALRGAGFGIDPKPFKPHITLARRLVCAEKPTVELPLASAPVRDFVLMRSDRVDGRLVYTPVFRKTLG